MTTQKQMDALEELRKNLVARLSAVSAEAINRTPDAGGWSAAQVLFHLVEAERLSLLYLQKKTQKPELIAKSGPVAYLKSRALGLFLRSPIKVKAPARTADVPDHIELEALARDWEELRSGWKTFVRDFPAEHAERAVYKHPRAGRLNLEQTLKFLIDHLRRHLRQVERALAEAAAEDRAA